MDISIVKYFATLCFGAILCPMIQIAAGALLVVAAKQISKQGGNQRLVLVCDTLGVAFIWFIGIASVQTIYLLIPVFWP